MPFESIIGQPQPILLLQKMLRSGVMPHAFIFHGIQGIGKHTTARAFARALNCEALPDNCCDRCTSCLKIERQVHPDVLCMEPAEDKKIISIAQLREMQEQIGYRPVEGRWKAVIIDEADRLQRESANCLLKTLEEPPDNTVLVLVAHSISGMLPTVLSRCQQIRFSPLGIGDIAAYLRRCGIAADRAGQVAAYAQGSIARALLLVDEKFLALRADMAEKLARGTAQHAMDSHTLAARLIATDETTGYGLDFLRFWYRDLLLLKAGIADAALLYNRDIVDALHAAAAHETSAGLVKKIERIHQLQNNPAGNLDAQLALESILLGM